VAFSVYRKQVLANGETACKFPLGLAAKSFA